MLHALSISHIVLIDRAVVFAHTSYDIAFVDVPLLNARYLGIEEKILTATAKKPAPKNILKMSKDMFQNAVFNVLEVRAAIFVAHLLFVVFD